MGEAHASEHQAHPDDLADPTGDVRLRPLPWIVRKHPDRVLVLASHRCFFHCRFCYRRGETRNGRPAPGEREWGSIARWIADRPEIREVILSGGDPLTLPDRVLARIGRLLASVPHVRAWRVHTRAPVVQPGRVTAGLIAALTSGPSARVVLHANHPLELVPAVRDAVARLRAGGIPVENQSVLLRGVNDRPEALAALVEDLARIGVRQRYLHHPDRAQGTARFRLSLRQGLALYRAFADRVSVPPPAYVVDLPNGAGKARVASLAAVAVETRGPLRRTRYRWIRPPGWKSVVSDTRYEWWDVWEETG